MRTAFLTMLAISTAALLYEFSWEKLAVGVAVTLGLPLAIRGYGKRVASRLDAERRAALAERARLDELQRRIDALRQGR